MTGSSGKRGRSRTGRGSFLAVLLLVGACGGGGSSAPPPGAATHPSLQDPIAYSFDSLDERPVSSKTLRGRPTVLAFVTTYDLESQAQVDYIATMAKHDADRINYAIVALERPENRELVEAFRHFVADKFGVSLAAAMADPATIAGGGPFGDVHVVPTVIVMDKSGKIRWQRTGLVKSDDIRAGLNGL